MTNGVVLADGAGLALPRETEAIESVLRGVQDTLSLAVAVAGMGAKARERESGKRERPLSWKKGSGRSKFASDLSPEVRAAAAAAVGSTCVRCINA